MSLTFCWKYPSFTTYWFTEEALEKFCATGLGLDQNKTWEWYNLTEKKLDNISAWLKDCHKNCVIQQGHVTTIMLNLRTYKTWVARIWHCKLFKNQSPVDSPSTTFFFFLKKYGFLYVVMLSQNNCNGVQKIYMNFMKSLCMTYKCESWCAVTACWISGPIFFYETINCKF